MEIYEHMDVRESFSRIDFGTNAPEFTNKRIVLHKSGLHETYAKFGDLYARWTFDARPASAMMSMSTCHTHDGKYDYSDKNLSGASAFRLFKGSMYIIYAYICKHQPNRIAFRPGGDNVTELASVYYRMAGGYLSARANHFTQHTGYVYLGSEGPSSSLVFEKKYQTPPHEEGFR